LNACKYSDNQQAIVILEKAQKALKITIRDKGKGIPDEELKTVFQPFYRIEENVATQGFGLGLSLADRIIKLHKGSIEVRSELHVGTDFFIFLPPAQLLSTGTIDGELSSP
jgi:signal transduction histidine kinase